MKKLIVLLVIFGFVFDAVAQNQIKINKSQLFRDVQTLSSDEYEGRQVGTEGSKKTQAFLIGRFKEVGLKPINSSYEQKFSPKTGINGTNLYGMIEGKVKDKYIVLTAHYDHLGKKDNDVYNGADDNASGVAALLAYADYFNRNKPNYSMIFLFVDAEEIGLKGADFFVKNAPIDKASILLNINCDMISRNEKKELYACGVFHSPLLKNLFTLDMRKYPFTLRFGHDQAGKNEDWTFSSDHGPFHKAKIPFIYFGVEDHADYHQTTDTFDKIDKAFYEGVSNFILDFLLNVDKNWEKVYK